MGLVASPGRRSLSGTAPLSDSGGLCSRAALRRTAPLAIEPAPQAGFPELCNAAPHAAAQADWQRRRSSHESYARLGMCSGTVVSASPTRFRRDGPVSRVSEMILSTALSGSARPSSVPAPALPSARSEAPASASTLTAVAASCGNRSTRKGIEFLSSTLKLLAPIPTGGGVGQTSKLPRARRRSMAISVEVEGRPPRPNPRAQDQCSPQARAMALWPRLDRRALARCGCDPARIANYVSRRTRLPTKAIEALLSQS